jgi:hypothetical protein
MKAYELCADFIKNHNPVVPDEIKERKRQNELVDKKGRHTNIPASKFSFGGDGTCLNPMKSCPSSGSRADEQVRLYSDTPQFGQRRLAHAASAFHKERARRVRARRAREEGR